MLIDTYELPCFVPSRLDGRALESLVAITRSRSTVERPGRAVVLLHPYAPLGGQFRNNVVSEVRRRMTPHVSVCIALNLRGAGCSEGRTSWTGQAEQEDLRSVLDMLVAGSLTLHAEIHPLEERRGLAARLHSRGFAAMPGDGDPIAVPLPPVERVMLCGYSYGAMIVGSVAPAEYPQLGLDYAYISYPYGVVWALALNRRSWYLQRIADIVTEAAASAAASAAETAETAETAASGSTPSANPHGGNAKVSRTFFIAGSADFYTSMSSYERWWAQLEACARHPTAAETDSGSDDVAARVLALVRAPKADHSWLRREDEVADAIQAWWR
ncbi:hypothetical protein GGI07_002093 [Coemansia sp. Benny D115]|nr:hypothetical protein GGI07_002093 [Coemansia sp. Benny D115]